jgi:hypothetical protein
MLKFTLALQLQRWSTSSYGTNIPIEVPPKVANSGGQTFLAGFYIGLLNSIAERWVQCAVSSTELEEADSIRHWKEGTR